ncbi:hypothetical protein L596_021272 [Steinernema carpocapsae]|uniref:Uncharacterized protein n=1 Tax=Steinernema carpocapsae TaxID=34508 RepID=A0A4U5MIA2_STECR|nr:hypothetical protein L596_021272 [Steinernema carpocapsae]
MAFFGDFLDSDSLSSFRSFNYHRNYNRNLLCCTYLLKNLISVQCAFCSVINLKLALNFCLTSLSLLPAVLSL